MACRGRCAGCGRTGPAREVTAHLPQCAQWAALYLEDPARALGPEEELERWQREDKAVEHAVLVATLRGASESRRAAQAARFTLADPLEE